MAAKSTIGLLMIGRSGCSGMVFQNPLISLLDKDFDSLHFTFFQLHSASALSNRIGLKCTCASQKLVSKSNIRRQVQDEWPSDFLAQTCIKPARIFP